MEDCFQAGGPRLEIPYLCADEPTCTAKHFRGWKGRQNWKRIADIPLTLLAGQLQSWLFFGLISAFFGRDFDRNSVLKASCSRGRTCIDLELLGPSLRNRVAGDMVGTSILPAMHDQGESPRIERQRKAKNIIHDGVGDLVDSSDQTRGLDGNRLAAETSPLPALDDGEQASRKQHLVNAEDIFYDTIDLVSEKVISYLKEKDDDTADLRTSDALAAIFGIDISIDILHKCLGPGRNKICEVRDRARRSLVAEVDAIRRSATLRGRCPSLAWRF